MELVPVEELDGAIAALAWNLISGELVKVVRRRDFADALAYVNDVGRLAEEAGHHPDITLAWDRVTLRLSTHSLGGITDADLALAGRIDSLG